MVNKNMMTVCLFVSVYYNDFKTKNDNVQPTASVERDKDENVNAVNLEVAESLMMTSALLNDTKASKAVTSNMDYTVPAEDKSDTIAIDSSKTRQFPDVLFDKITDKEIYKKKIFH